MGGMGGQSLNSLTVTMIAHGPRPFPRRIFTWYRKIPHKTLTAHLKLKPRSPNQKITWWPACRFRLT
jgi:hypothetical protein